MGHIVEEWTPTVLSRMELFRMSFSRRVTAVVILTLIMSAMSTVFCAPAASHAEGTVDDNSSTLPVAGPYAVKLPAVKTLKHNVRIALPKVGRIVGAIITKQKVINQFNVARTNSEIDTVIDFAMAQIGDPYVWGGNGPNGWDCSGLMVGAFHQVGVNLPRTSRAQFTIGTPVEYGQWQPGDLLFFGSSASSIHHVVLYIGNGQIVHASTFGVPVKVDSIRGGGSDYFGARRIIG